MYAIRSYYGIGNIEDTSGANSITGQSYHGIKATSAHIQLLEEDDLQQGRQISGSDQSETTNEYDIAGIGHGYRYVGGMAIHLHQIV